MAKINNRIKTNLHPRNRNRGQYDFKKLIEISKDLEAFVNENKYGNLSINYFNNTAVKLLNAALIKLHYDIDWNIPDGYLIPPLPGRSDYIHYMSDVLVSSHHKPNKSIPADIKFLDIGTGANCIYPIIGKCEYRWSSVGTDINESSLKIAQSIIDKNKNLDNKIELRLQANSNHYFKNIIKKDEYFDFTICNPPFYSSPEQAIKANTKKQYKLTNHKSSNYNFGGHSHELWSKGGELNFTKQLIEESFLFKSSCYWFSTLVSKQDNLNFIEKEIRRFNPTEVKLIKMSQGQKSSRIIIWTFLTQKQKDIWSRSRWNHFPY